MSSMLGLLGGLFSINEDSGYYLLIIIIVTLFISIHFILSEQGIIKWVHPLRDVYDVSIKIIDDELKDSSIVLERAQNELEKHEKILTDLREENKSRH